MTGIFRIIFLLLLSSQCITAQDKHNALPPGLDAYIAKVLQTFEVPGISVAIVKDGKPLLAKGYGVKKMGEAAPVDANTLFAIASNSKAFTATALAMLVEEGKLKWDDPVVNYLPSFKTSDIYITANLTIRDLLVHQSGIPAYAGDLMIFPLPIIQGRRSSAAYGIFLLSMASELPMLMTIFFTSLPVK